MSRRPATKTPAKQLPKPTAFIAHHAEQICARLKGPIADIAGGSGRNLVPFLHTGWPIDTYDIRPDCVYPEIARKCKSLKQHTADLLSDEFTLPEGKYALVMLVHFYDPRVIEKIIPSLTPDGFLLLETIEDRKGNYHALPRVGEIFDLLARRMRILHCQAKQTGPKWNRQVVKLLAERT